MFYFYYINQPYLRFYFKIKGKNRRIVYSSLTKISDNKAIFTDILC